MTSSRQTPIVDATTDTPDPHDAPKRHPKRRRRRATTAAVLAVIAVLLVVNTSAVDGQALPAASTGTIGVDGTALYVQQDGPATAPVLVLLHGLGESTHSWDAVTPALAASHRVIRIDLLGHGRSAKPAGDVYSIAHQATLVGDVLARLGVTHAVVVGHSTGGYVATALAEQRRSLVAGLVLVDTGPSLAAFISSGPTGNLLTTPVLGPLIWRFRTDAILRKAASSAFSRPGFEAPQQMIDDLNGMTYHSLTATSLASDAFLEQRPEPQRLTPLGVPLLVLYGADDHRFHPSSYAQYRVVPGALVEDVPGVGHSPMLEDPGRTAALILDFLRSDALR